MGATDTVSPSTGLTALGVDADRPLLIVDVDEVLGLFMEGFERFAVGRGFEFRLDRFALFQNLYRPGEDAHVDLEEGRALFADFFRYACGEIAPTPGGPEALRELSRRASVVILSNAPGPGRMARARWLGRHGMDYPLLLNTGPKGPLAAALARQSRGPVVFIDDLLPNLDSVAEAAPQVARFQMVADRRLRPLAPTAPDRHPRLDEWPDLAAAVEAVIRA